MGATWKSVNHENLACAYKWDFDFGYEQVAKADCECPICNVHECKWASDSEPYL